MTNTHPYQGPDDLMKLRAFLISMRAGLGHSCWHVGDLVWRFFLHSIRYDLSQTVQLWESNGGELLGFAVVTPPGPREDGGRSPLFFEFQVHPRARGSGLEDQMLTWVERYWQRARYGAPFGPGGQLSTDVGVYADDESQIAALTHRGFFKEDNDAILLWHSLDGALPVVPAPDDFVLRAVTGLPEVTLRTEVHRAAFAPSRITVDGYSQLMQMPGYTPLLDRVAVAPTGEFAAFALGWLDSVNGVGEFEPVGTNPRFRRLGLAKAVVRDGMQAMRDRGASCVVIGPVEPRSTAAWDLYRSLGFRETGRVLMYSRRL